MVTSICQNAHIYVKKSIHFCQKGHLFMSKFGHNFVKNDTYRCQWTLTACEWTLTVCVHGLHTDVYHTSVCQQ